MEAAPSLVDATADGDALLLLADGAHLRAHLLMLRKASPLIERMAEAGLEFAAPATPGAPGAFRVPLPEDGAAEWRTVLEMLMPVVPRSRVSWSNLAPLLLLAERHGMRWLVLEADAFVERHGRDLSLAGGGDSSALALLPLAHRLDMPRAYAACLDRLSGHWGLAAEALADRETVAALPPAVAKDLLWAAAKAAVAGVRLSPHSGSM